MTNTPLRVGIVGADTKASWAKISHIPAIQGLAELELAAVALRSEQSAKEAAEAFGAKKWFSDAGEMIRSDDIDIVTVGVNVPAHRDLVLAALEAGKHVYCESPLGRSSEETVEIASAVASLQHVAIGLQSRLNPSVRRAAQLINEGAIGTVLNARVVSTTSGFGAVTAKQYLYFEDAASGANLLTITAGHTLDIMEALFGNIVEVGALTATLWPFPSVMDTGETAQRSVPDHAEIVGLTDRKTVINASILGGVAPEHGTFELQVRGSDGWLTLSGGHPYGFQAGDFTLKSSATFDAPDAPAVTGGLLDAAMNVGELYASLVRDIQNSTNETPGFDHALRNTRLIDAVRRAGESGQRQAVLAG